MQRVFFIFIILIFTACGDNVPSGVLSRQEMASVLIDLHVAESKVDRLGVRTDSAKVLYELMEAEVLEDHHIDQDTYMNSLSFYLENLNKFESVYGIVVDSLSLQEQMVSSENESNR
ncbi:MAG: DUF4296 domain-containing protein [Candidatus Cyclobacteriaceae bacterium M3_2C_046]